MWGKLCKFFFKLHDITKLTDLILLDWRDKYSPLNFTKYDVLPHNIEVVYCCGISSPCVTTKITTHQPCRQYRRQRVCLFAVYWRNLARVCHYGCWGETGVSVTSQNWWVTWDVTLHNGTEHQLPRTHTHYTTTRKRHGGLMIVHRGPRLILCATCNCFCSQL